MQAGNESPAWNGRNPAAKYVCAELSAFPLPGGFSKHAPAGCKTKRGDCIGAGVLPGCGGPEGGGGGAKR